MQSLFLFPFQLVKDGEIVFVEILDERGRDCILIEDVSVNFGVVK